jgi:hypothetical protein
MKQQKISDEGVPRDSEAKKAMKELNHAVSATSELLCEIDEPLSLFPVHVKLDRSKIIARRNMLFYNKNILSIPIENVLNVTGSINILTGYLRIDEQSLGRRRTHKIGYFWKSDAEKFACIAQGYCIALRKNINVDAIEKEDLIKLLKNLGEI